MACCWESKWRKNVRLTGSLWSCTRNSFDKYKQWMPPTSNCWTASCKPRSSSKRKRTLWIKNKSRRRISSKTCRRNSPKLKKTWNNQNKINGRLTSSLTTPKRFCSGSQTRMISTSRIYRSHRRNLRVQRQLSPEWQRISWLLKVTQTNLDRNFRLRNKPWRSKRDFCKPSPNRTPSNRRRSSLCRTPYARSRLRARRTTLPCRSTKRRSKRFREPNWTSAKNCATSKLWSPIWRRRTSFISKPWVP